MPAAPKYNSEYHDDWAWSLAIRGATDQEIASAFGVSKRTIIRWKQDHESFAESLERGKSGANAKVERTLYQRAMGYDYEEKETVIEMDKDGNTKPAKIRTVKRHVPGEVGAMCFWLKNRSPDEWADRPRGIIEIEDMDDIEEQIRGQGAGGKGVPKAKDNPV